MKIIFMKILIQNYKSKYETQGTHLEKFSAENEHTPKKWEQLKSKKCHFHEE